MILDTAARDRLVTGILGGLERAVPGSQAALRGSLASGTADRYSDIDVLWEVPDDLFAPAVGGIGETLGRVGPGRSLRSDPDFQRSDRRRLFFARFEGAPAFWRLDLDVLARSVGRDERYDRDNPDARGADWSLAESALANAVAALKAHLRGGDELAGELLGRAYRRVGLGFPDLPPRELILRLADRVSAMDPETSDFAAEVRELTEGSFPPAERSTE